MSDLCESTARELKKLADRLEKLEIFVGAPKQSQSLENELKLDIVDLTFQLDNEKRRNHNLQVENEKLKEEILEHKQKALEKKQDVQNEGKKELEQQVEQLKSKIAKLEDIISLKQISEDNDEKTIDALRAENEQQNNWCEELERRLAMRPSCDGCDEEFSETAEDRTPRVLLCGHTLCQECIQEIIGKSNYVQCPIDQLATIVGCDLPPLNFAILKIL